jgi:hypothetical protein
MLYGEVPADRSEVHAEYINILWVKVKITLKQAVMAQRGSRDIALLFL